MPNPDKQSMPSELLGSLPEAGACLLITRQTLDLAQALRDRRPGLDVTVLNKNDFTGKSGKWLLGRLRERAWDAVILEDPAAESSRRGDLYRVMLLLARARTRLLVLGEPPRVTPLHGLRDSLRLVGTLFLESALTIRALLGAVILLLTVRPRPPRPLPDSGHVAYLRTDFWFGVKAGGSVSHIHGFLSGMRESGREPTVVTSDHLAALPDGVREVVVPPASRPSLVEEAALMAYNRRFTQGAVEALRKDPPDLVVHRHAVFALEGVLVARALDRPLVLEVNSSEVWVKKNWSRLHFEWIASAMERRALACADRVTVVSSVLRDQIAALGVDPARIVVNPNGTEPERFDPGSTGESLRAYYGIPGDALVAGFLGTFTRWHGVLFLAEQVAALCREEPKLYFLFIGDGDLRAAVQERITSDGIDNRARFTGLIGPDEIPDLLAACDILVSPHLPFEDGTPFFGSPTKLFEYMAAGRPIAASRLGQIGDLLEDGVTARLFEPGDAEGLRAAILDLARDPELRSRLARTARDTVSRDYTWAANARRALDPSPKSTRDTPPD